MSGTRPERNAAYLKKVRAEAIAAGRCGYCYKRPKLSGMTWCSRCRRIRNQKNAEDRAEYVAHGDCSICGYKRDDPAFKMCSSCREQARARTAKRMAAGLCRRCGEKRDDEFKICSACRKVESMKRRASAY